MEALAQRMFGHEGVQASDLLSGAPPLEVTLDSQLERRETKLFQPPRLGRGERLVQEIRERRSTPERQRPVRGLPGTAVAAAIRGIADQPLEAESIDHLGIEPQLVGATVRHDLRAALAREQLAQLRDVELDVLRGARRLLLTPQTLDHPVHRDRRVGVQASSDSTARCLGTPSNTGRPSSLSSTGP